MKKFLIISAIVLMVIVALSGNSEEDAPEEEVNASDTKIEETTNKSRSEMTDEEKEEAKREYEEKKAKEEQDAKEKQEAKEERKAKEEKEKEEQKAKEEREAKQKAEEAEKVNKENEAKEKAEQEDAETMYLQIMRESVGSYVDIQFNKTEKTYVMTPTDQGLIDEISMLPMGIGHEDWGVLVDGMSALSKSGKDLVGGGYSMTLVNPLNHENIILWIVDGEVIYNVIDDL